MLLKKTFPRWFLTHSPSTDPKSDGITSLDTQRSIQVTVKTLFGKKKIRKTGINKKVKIEIWSKDSELWLNVCMLTAQSLTRGWPFVTPRTTARQAPLSMGFFRQEYWSGLPFPTPGDLPKPVIESRSPESPAQSHGFFTTEAPWKPKCVCVSISI